MQKVPGRSWPRWLASAGLAWVPLAIAQAPSLPTGMSFVAQDASLAWALYRVDGNHAAVRVPTQFEPRQACVSPDGTKAVYSAADGSIRALSVSDNREAMLASADAKRSFTQPCLSSDGQEAYVVEMEGGKSLETEILRMRSGVAAPERIARQPGAQHDPFVHQKRWLVYASVGCSDGCDELLVEIWSRDLLTGKARQLTLLNALSQGPVTDGRRVVFSSNRSGTHQIWQVGMDGGESHQLTRGLAQAVHPALCGGTVHFVQSAPNASAIARLAEDGTVVELPVPGLKSFRALRCL